MKQFISLCLLAIFIPTYAGDKLELRAALGYNRSVLGPDPRAITIDSKGSYQFGADIIWGKWIYFNTGIYSLSLTSTYNNSFNNVTDNVRFNSLKLPFYVGLRLIPPSLESKVNARVFAGPSLTVMRNVKSDDVYISPSDYNVVLWGGNIGAGVDFFRFFAEAGYEFGLTNLYENTTFFGTTKASYFWANVGIRFKL